MKLVTSLDTTVTAAAAASEDSVGEHVRSGAVLRAAARPLHSRGCHGFRQGSEPVLQAAHRH